MLALLALAYLADLRVQDLRRGLREVHGQPFRRALDRMGAMLVHRLAPLR